MSEYEDFKDLAKACLSDSWKNPKAAYAGIGYAILALAEAIHSSNVTEEDVE